MPPIPNKPVHPQVPPGQQGPHQPAPPSAEQLDRMREMDEAAHRDEPKPEAEPQALTPSTDSAPDEASPAGPARQKPGLPTDRDRPGADKKDAFRFDPKDTRGSELPQQTGRPKMDLTPLMHRGETTARNSQEFHEALTQMKQEHAGNDADPSRPGRPLPEQPTRGQYRSVAQDKVFQGGLNGSPLHQKMQAKTLEQSRQERTQGERRATDEVLKRGELAQLFRMRHKFEKKDDARHVARYEIAKARKEAKEKVNALKSQTEGGGQKEDTQKARRAARMEGEGDPIKDHLSEKLKSASGETAFEQILQEVLDGGESVPELPESVRARFSAKSEAEWEEFFKNALSLTSSEIESEGQLDKLVEALFRGLYRRGADGKMMLVSDLTFTGEAGTEPAEHKFSRIALKDLELTSLLEKLKPGDIIDKELLKKIGDQFLFIQLLHVVDQLTVTEEQKKAILKEFRQQVSAGSRDNLEKALQERRERNAKRDAELPNPLAAAAGDLLSKKDRHTGPPRFVMYMIYGVLAVTVVLILTILFRNM